MGSTMRSNFLPLEFFYRTVKHMQVQYVQCRELIGLVAAIIAIYLEPPISSRSEIILEGSNFIKCPSLATSDKERPVP